MRPIKFRVWHDVDKKWLHGYAEHGEGCSILGETIIMGMWLSECHDLMDQTNVVVEQFIDCLDSDENEIYEGDIVEYGRIGEPLMRGRVEYAAPEFAIEPNYDYFSISPFGLADCSGYCIRVIGNIHENMNLLEAIK